MKLFLKSKALKLLVFALIVALVGSVIAIATVESVSPVSTVVGTVFSPIQKLAGKISNKISSFNAGFTGSKSLQQEVERLNEQIEQYELQLVDYDEVKHRLQSYEDILELKDENPDFELVYSEIIGADTQDAFSSLIIDRGESDGVKTGDPVVSGSYLVGTISKVNKSYSVVETLLNPKINISAMESRSRETSYVTSTVQQALKGNCVFAGLDTSTAVSPGGIIITSGIGGVYPKGLIIGHVSRILESEYDLTSYAVVVPSVDFSSLEDVFVVSSFNGQGVSVVE